MKERFLARFSKKEKPNELSEALRKFENLKQKGRPIKEYYKEVRELTKVLPKDLHSELGLRMIRGLDDKTVRAVTGGIMRKKKADL